jgi:hypothetical protein
MVMKLIRYTFTPPRMAAGRGKIFRSKEYL